MKKKTTIHDLARELNLDSSTISRALNDSPRVGAKTKKRVLEKAKELNYSRNMMASNLRSSKTMTIGVVVPYISRHFFSEAIDGIEQIMTDKNYRVVISQSHDKPDVEEKIVNGLFMNRVDGLLISPSMGAGNDDLLKLFYDNNIPVVLFDRYFKSSNLNKVIFEDKFAAKRLTQHLIDQGCKKIYHLAGNLKAQVYQQRFEGYQEALNKKNLAFEPSFVFESTLNPQDAITIVKKIIKNKKNLPDGIVCANDISAIAIMKYLDENTDIKVPEDIAIAGFSNEPASDIIKPGLTTVDQNGFKMGETAANMLLEAIDNKEEYDADKTVIIHSEIIKRNSTKKVS